MTSAIGAASAATVCYVSSAPGWRAQSENCHLPELPLVDGVGLWCDIRRTFEHVPALFVDRDGVIIEDVHYLDRPDDVRLIAGAAAAIAACNVARVPVVMVTNQSGIGRGYFGWDGFAAVQDALVGLLAAEGAHLDAVLACAYHADGRPPYDVADHPWRKPQPGMIEEAGRRMELDLSRSFMIGDKADDMVAARAGGLSGGVIVATGYGSTEHAKALALTDTAFRVEAAGSIAEAVPAVIGRLVRRADATDTQR